MNHTKQIRWVFRLFLMAVFFSSTSLFARDGFGHRQATQKNSSAESQASKILLKSSKISRPASIKEITEKHQRLIDSVAKNKDLVRRYEHIRDLEILTYRTFLLEEERSKLVRKNLKMGNRIQEDEQFLNLVRRIKQIEKEREQLIKGFQAWEIKRFGGIYVPDIRLKKAVLVPMKRL